MRLRARLWPVAPSRLGKEAGRPLLVPAPKAEISAVRDAAGGKWCIATPQRCATNRFVLEESLGGGSGKTPTKKALF